MATTLLDKLAEIKQSESDKGEDGNAAFLQALINTLTDEDTKVSGDSEVEVTNEVDEDDYWIESYEDDEPYKPVSTGC